MKLLALVGFVIVIVVVAAGISEDEARRQFEEFKVVYGRNYGSREEEVFGIFKKNLVLAEKYQNEESGTAQYGVTQFSDLTPEEFREQYLMKRNETETLFSEGIVEGKIRNIEIPDAFDWKSKGVITNVYNQGQCGSCWAFSATETMESFWALAGHSLVSLSMQQVVDCDKVDHGCRGGWTEKAFEYVIKQGGIQTYSSYPYSGRDGSCRFSPSSVAAKFSSWSYVTRNRDENQMANFLYSKGPLSVCVDASSWQSYRGGVMASCGKSINHCVQATGFQKMDGRPVWNIRNSWGTGWGVSGYAYLLRGQDTCAVAQDVTAVTAA